MLYGRPEDSATVHFGFAQRMPPTDGECRGIATLF
jgi:hypothetical protein